MKTIGIDVGSSSVKVSLMDVAAGDCVASATRPDAEMPITALCDGWAEQDPAMWWQYVCEAIREIGRAHDLRRVAAVGVTYQMHALVCLDDRGRVLRPAIIWCDSRAVPYGERALSAIGEERCQRHLLNSPGNFTASRMAWVKENEPGVFRAADRFIGAGDYIANKLTGELSTTDAGLSEQMLWDYGRGRRADFVLEYFGIPAEKIPESYPYSIGPQGRVSPEAERETGIPAGTPVTYRVGDQPNNAFSLGILDSGEVAATGGTSGVLCAITDRPAFEPQWRVNTFMHVNSTLQAPRNAVLVCVTAAGILNAWARRTLAPGMSYGQINRLCATIAPGSEGVLVLPFGNGVERLFGNRTLGASIGGLNLNIHNRVHILRAVQEGIAYNFLYGMEVLEGMGLTARVIRAGHANLFLSPVFASTLATLLDTRIELYDTDGALGVARGAALGAGLYRDMAEALAPLKVKQNICGDSASRDVLLDGYARWKEKTSRLLDGK